MSSSSESYTSAELDLMKYCSLPLFDEEREGEEEELQPNTFIPADRKMFEKLYKQFLIWLESQTDKINMLSEITNLWTTSSQAFYRMMNDYYVSVHHLQQPELYLPSMELFDQMHLEFELNNEENLVGWLEGLNTSFLSRIQRMAPKKESIVAAPPPPPPPEISFPFSNEISELVTKIIQVTDNRQKSIQDELLQSKRKYDELLQKYDDYVVSSEKALEEQRKRTQKVQRTNNDLNIKCKNRLQKVCDELLDISNMKK